MASIKDVKNELLHYIDSRNPSEVEKVERYISLLKDFRQLEKAITKFGVMITVKNGGQEFTKANPAVNEKNRINNSLLKLQVWFDKRREEIEYQNKKNGTSQSLADIIANKHD